MINFEQTFNNFIIDESNKEAYKKALMCIEKPDKLYNPLFIQGDAYMGKTHLLNAIANKYMNDHPNSNVVYITGMDFMEEAYLADENKTLDVFIPTFTNVNLLIFDEIMQISNSTEAINAFNYIVKKAISNNIQVCLSSIEPFDKLLNICEFECKNSVNISTPTEVVSYEIIKKICIEYFDSVVFKDDAFRYMAKIVSNEDASILELIIEMLKYLGLNNQTKIVDSETIQKALDSQNKK